MYKISYKQVPINIKSMVTSASDVHHNNTRQYSQHHILKYKTEIKRSLFKIVGSKIWNCLKTKIKQLTNSVTHQILLS